MRKIDRDVSEYYNQKLQLLLNKLRIIYIATRYMVTRGHNQNYIMIAHEKSHALQLYMATRCHNQNNIMKAHAKSHAFHILTYEQDNDYGSHVIYLWLSQLSHFRYNVTMSCKKTFVFIVLYNGKVENKTLAFIEYANQLSWLASAD